MAYVDPNAKTGPLRRPVAVQGRARKLAINPSTGQVEDDGGRAVADVSEGEARDLAAAGRAGDWPAPAKAPPGDPADELTRRLEAAFDKDEAARKAMTDESWRTLSARRQLPASYGTADEAARAGAGAAREAGDRYSQATQLPGGKWVSGGQADVERALAGSDNAADQMAFIKATMPQLYGRAVYGPNGPQGGQAPDQQLMASLLGQAQGAAQGVFEGDTKRGVAGVQEYEQKFTKPEENKNRLATQELQNKGLMEREKEVTGREITKAEMQDKTARDTVGLQMAARDIQEGKNLDLVRARNKDFNEVRGEGEQTYRDSKKPGAADAGPRIHITKGADGQPVAVVGGDGRPAKKAGPAALDSAGEKKVADFIARWTGEGLQQGQQMAKYSLDAFLDDVAANPEVLNSPSFQKAFREKGVGGTAAGEVQRQIAKEFLFRNKDLSTNDFITDQDEFGGFRVTKDDYGTLSVVGPGGASVYRNVPLMTRNPNAGQRADGSLLGNALRKARDTTGAIFQGYADELRGVKPMVPTMRTTTANQIKGRLRTMGRLMQMGLPQGGGQ
jgi:hypothetical protein